MSAPIVAIEEGKLRGKIEKDFLGGSYYSFLGVPYAKAPIRELRFKAPVAAEPWEGILDATQEGPECPSRHMVFLYRVGCEENCLNLNVFTKNLPNESKPLKPVMVWIHGGGFLYGSNKKELYNPDYLITEDIVLVCINYRVGVLGFLSLEDPSLNVPGNAGLKDMVLALKWVQKNITNFCGDPNNVTIFGESAGSAAVQYLMMSPSAKGLFHKAICQSGSCLNLWAKGATNGKIIAKYLGLEETEDKKILEHLQTLPAQKIVDAQKKSVDNFDANTLRPYGPVIEPKWSLNPFLNEDPIDLIKSGRFNQVPLIMGYNSTEGMLFEAIKALNLGSKMSDKINFEREISFEFNLKPGSQESKEIAERIKNFYFKDEKPTKECKDKFYLIKTDNMFLHGIYESVNLQKQVSTAPIYLYKLTLDTPTNFMKRVCMTKLVPILIFLYFLISTVGDGIIKKFLLWLAHLLPQKQEPGTCHADDLGFLFRTFVNPELEPKSPEEIYVKRFVRMWANFARNGDPTPDGDDSLLNVKWKPVGKEENSLLNIGKELKVEKSTDEERMKVWNDITSRYRR